MNYNPSLARHFGRNFVEPNVTKPRRSIGRRISRAFVRYSIVLSIGIGATLAWQSYRDEAIELVRTKIPSVAWLLPISTAQPALDAIPSAEVAQQLKPMADDLAIVRRSAEQLATKVEQLSAKQDQMAENFATLQSVEQEVKKLSSPPSAQTVPAHKPSQQPTAKSSATQPSSAVYPSRLLQPDLSSR
jgi:cell pole-organizing protein PopZ